jgi:exodeoxyribonuclease V beta subunit
MKALDPARMPIDGYCLVEASAGTGKTYAITSLFLRLIMERGLKVRDILVVTFTKAATEELRFKIRERLDVALGILRGRISPGKDDFVKELAALAVASGRVERRTMIGRLEEAMLSLDESSVFTIHSFCQRMLREFAFESNAPFHAELLLSVDEVQRAACMEFVRKTFYNRRSELAEWAGRLFSLGNLPWAIHGEIAGLLSTPAPLILYEHDIKAVVEEAGEFMEKIGQAASIVKGRRDELVQRYVAIAAECVDTLLGMSGLSGIPSDTAGKFRKKVVDIFAKKVREHFTLLDSLASSDAVMPFNDGDLSLLHPGTSLVEEVVSIVRDVEKTGKSRRTKLYSAMEPFFPGIYAALDGSASSGMEKKAGEEMRKFFREPGLDILARALVVHGSVNDRFFAAVVSEAVRFVRRYVREYQRRRSLLSYDDMIVMLRDALWDREIGKGLADTIRGRFPVAMIDEFQDTDSSQWKIFSAIYPDSRRSSLFLIGDPKQAIYGFRGADIFTYLEARGMVDESRRFNLDTNWRSTPGIVSAMNRLFMDGRKRSFVLEGIDFQPVKAREGFHEELVVDGEAGPSVEIWSLGESRDMDDGCEGEAVSHEPEMLAALEIRGLIDKGRRGAAFFQGETDRRPLAPGDITVLVKDYMEARRMRNALLALDIPSVYNGPGSVFATEEAKDIRHMLCAVAGFTDERAVCTALATISLGFTARGIHALLANPEKWDSVVEKFANLREKWAEHGVFPMLRALFREFDIPSRLLRLRGGERRLTNLRQISELLAMAEREHPGMEMLIAWLNSNIAEPDNSSDEHKLRLETDENLVTIMSYHRSKGLEFPVLFLPFIHMAQVRQGRKKIFRCYDVERRCYVVPLAERRLSEDETPGRVPCGSMADRWREESRRQQEAELARLMYVAFTRARQKIYFAIDGDAATDSMIGALVDKGGVEGDARKGVEGDGWQTSMRQAVEGLFSDISSVKVIAACEKFDSMDMSGKGGPGAAMNDHVRPPVISRSPLAEVLWRPASFSSLHASRTVEGEPDVFLSDMARDEALDRFSFPRGPMPGNCVHRFFELVDFHGGMEHFLDVAESSLGEFGMDGKWAGVLAEMGLAVVNARLAPGIRLKDIGRRWISREAGFTWSFGGNEKIHLAGLPDGCETGVVSGFTDLMFRHGDAFYLLDYKTNWLGGSVEDYGLAAMRKAMDQHDYWLQAGIYARALHEFLRTGMPDYRFSRHLAGVFYLFVRGVTVERGEYGVLFVSREELTDRFPGFFREALE